jgi:hypothetical protein
MSEMQTAPIAGGRPDVAEGSSPSSVQELTDVLNGSGAFAEATCECGAEIASICDACGDAFCDDHLLWGGEAGPTLCHACAWPIEGALAT